MSASQPRALWVRSIEFVSVWLFFIVLSWKTVNVLPIFLNGATAWVLLPAALAAYLAADFFSGLVHWFCDRFFEEDSPVIGPMIIAPFRDHHRDPLGITRHDFYELNGNNCLVVLPVLILFVGVAPILTLFAAPFWQAFLLLLAFFIFSTNQFHSWAHVEKKAPMIARLQKIGLILSPNMHAAHHCGDHSKGYCVTVGWLNPLLDRLKFFTAAEKILSALGVPLSQARETSQGNP